MYGIHGVALQMLMITMMLTMMAFQPLPQHKDLPASWLTDLDPDSPWWNARVHDCSQIWTPIHRGEMQEFPNKHWPLTTVKRLQWKIDDSASGRKRKEKLLLNKNIV